MGHTPTESAKGSREDASRGCMPEFDPKEHGLERFFDFLLDAFSRYSGIPKDDSGQARTTTDSKTPQNAGCYNRRCMNFQSATHSEAAEKPEWIRVPMASQLFGISRSTLYKLIKDGKIKSKCLRARGAVLGTRLISYDSLNDYIERHGE